MPAFLISKLFNPFGVFTYDAFHKARFVIHYILKSQFKEKAMNRNRTQLALGLILVLIGAGFIAVRQIPALSEWFNVAFTWPFSVIGIGALLFLIGLLVGAPGLAVPAAIVAGIGGILYYQELTNDWASWSYMWTLIPGFVGVGTLLSALLGGGRGGFRAGVNLIFISAVLFLVFGLIFGGMNFISSEWAAVLLILLGAWIILQGFIRRFRSDNRENGS
jgi:hypothetical protein